MPSLSSLPCSVRSEGQVCSLLSILCCLVTLWRNEELAFLSRSFCDWATARDFVLIQRCALVCKRFHYGLFSSHSCFNTSDCWRQRVLRDMLSALLLWLVHHSWSSDLQGTEQDSSIHPSFLPQDHQYKGIKDILLSGSICFGTVRKYLCFVLNLSCMCPEPSGALCFYKKTRREIAGEEIAFCTWLC